MFYSYTYTTKTLAWRTHAKPDMQTLNQPILQKIPFYAPELYSPLLHFYQD